MSACDVSMLLKHKCKVLYYNCVKIVIMQDGYENLATAGFNKFLPVQKFCVDFEMRKMTE
jgi:hypothetical protein